MCNGQNEGYEASASAAKSQPILGKGQRGFYLNPPAQSP
jgi:hypothetical protein